MGAFSVVGFPPFSGLWGKVFVVSAIAREASWQSWLVIAVIVVASCGALLSMLRVWRLAFWGKPMENAPKDLVVPLWLGLPGAALAVLSVAMFFCAGSVVSVTLDAAAELLDVPSYTSAVLGDVSEAIGVPR